MLDGVNKELISFLFKGELPTQDPSQIHEDRQTRRREKFNTSKEEVLNSDEMAARSRATGQTQQRQAVETIVREQPKIGRNDRVVIKNVVSGENKTLKFKQAEPLLKKGQWVLVEN
jgi:preprotein translocase subunit SecA